MRLGDGGDGRDLHCCCLRDLQSEKRSGKSEVRDAARAPSSARKVSRMEGVEMDGAGFLGNLIFRF